VKDDNSGMLHDQLVRRIGALLRRLQVGGDRISATFASRQGLHHTDLAALIHIMDAEASAAPLTPGQLQAALGLSSGATTSVVDRLERQGHARRDRDTVDRRRIHLHFSDSARSVAQEFFGPLGSLTGQVMDEFTDAELEVVQRFLTGMVAAYDTAANTAADTAAGTPARAGNR
jgi:DNA-binding MarR family transcriptional regulator